MFLTATIARIVLAATGRRSAQMLARGGLHRGDGAKGFRLSLLGHWRARVGAEELCNNLWAEWRLNRNRG